MKRNIATVFAAAWLVGAPLSAQAANNVLITPSTDPGGVMVGDSLTFVISVDSVEPPTGATWERLSIGSIKAIGPDRTNSYVDRSTCSDLSGLELRDPDTSFCPFWIWRSLLGGTDPIAGDLFSFNVLFPEPGTYLVYIEGASASFDGAADFSLTRSFPDIFNALVITVSDTPENLLSQLLEDVTEIGKPGKSLRGKLLLAQAYLEADDTPATCAVLADFTKQVKAQMGKKKISTVVGDRLITDATAIMTAIGCFD